MPAKKIEVVCTKCGVVYMRRPRPENRDKPVVCRPCATRENQKKAFANDRFHGGSQTALYQNWQTMKNRCYRPSFTQYKNYGGKGIRVCDEWHDWETFRAWALMAGYEEGLCIDRIDPDGNYSPGNCRYITRSENSRESALRNKLGGSKKAVCSTPDAE